MSQPPKLEFFPPRSSVLYHANSEAQLKFFLIMPLHHRFNGSEGRPCSGFPHLDYCHIYYSRDKAEVKLLEIQKADPLINYILLESTHFCESHPTQNEWRLADTLQY